MLYKSNSPKETENIAVSLAKRLKQGDVICLNGDLGVGKTAFVKGIAKGLNITEHIQSPTFTIVNTYDGSLKLNHFDVYRIADSDEILDIGFEEYLTEGVTVIEWSDMISDILPKERYVITISKNLEIHEDYREINIEKLD